MGKNEEEMNSDNSDETKLLEYNLNFLNSYAIKQLAQSSNKKFDDKFIEKSNKLIKLLEINDKNSSRKRAWLFQFNWINFLGTLLLLIGVIVLTWDSVRIYFVFLSRILIILFSYFYDLTLFYQKSCLIQNPFLVETNSFDPNDCKLACKSTFPQLFLNETNVLTEKLFDELVLDLNIPIIEANEMKQWNLAKFDSKSISKAYCEKLKNLKETDFCYFDSTIKKVNGSILSYFNYTTKYVIKNGYKAMWENCNKVSSRIIKKHIKRPSYLPSYLELVSNNWILLTVNDPFDEYINLPASLRVVLIFQIKGEMKIKLKPIDECSKDCEITRFKLHQGQTFIFSDLWNVEYKFAHKMENLALILLVY